MSLIVWEETEPVDKRCWCWHFSLIFYFYLLAAACDAEVPRAGIEPTPQQWRCRTLNPLCRQGIPYISFVSSVTQGKWSAASYHVTLNSSPKWPLPPPPYHSLVLHWGNTRSSLDPATVGMLLWGWFSRHSTEMLPFHHLRSHMLRCLDGREDRRGLLPRVTFVFLF